MAINICVGANAGGIAEFGDKVSAKSPLSATLLEKRHVVSETLEQKLLSHVAYHIQLCDSS
ncbi:hypothetical protein T03_1486 [Trichinella britovi]|uniref:Uncharacterized protein n=2 Tax=Trichinella TaxID=6333 RepID=A0A0V1CRP9_TRIBR|nr:hypothetical protein T05_9335 [Trichinella murrelli]KRX57516.1 hypothetical protein T09_6464 [Trichinella sp. T9]KRY51395.1 hypothetical protein T03_1486 [Trichinella britovi]KRZ87169.1 hypothetical protein T08_16470 [Trichinella sp. T8]